MRVIEQALLIKGEYVMPEYLAPGVYIEEVSSGNKPIQAASTSTAGMVGMTTRGPVDSPTMVTSLGEANRVFGGKLDHHIYGDGLDALPYAIEGFFKNGGSRVYITRIVGNDAKRAIIGVYSQDLAGSNEYTLSGAVAAAATTLTVTADPLGLLADGLKLLFSALGKTDIVTVDSVDSKTIVLNRALTASDDDTLTVCEVKQGDDVTGNISGDMLAAGVLLVDATLTAALKTGDVLLLEDTKDADKNEYLTIAGDASAVFTENGGVLLFDHPTNSTKLSRVTITDGNTLTVSANVAATRVGVDENLIGTEKLIRADADDEYYQINDTEIGLTIKAAIANTYATGTTATTVGANCGDVIAIHPGGWGDNLRVRAQNKSLLQTELSSAALTADTQVVLKSVFAVQQGTYLKFTATPTTSVVRKVIKVDRKALQVTLSAALGADIAIDAAVQSVEFDLIVQRLENDKVVESERFDDLALDPSHPSYAPAVVGTFDTQTGKPSKSGASELIRFSSYTAGRMPLAGPNFDLTGGDDDVANVDDTRFLGKASDDPDARTGIQAMVNESEISIVAVPGQTSVDVQKGLIAHCEMMRYRFAVLDSQQNAKLKTVQTHRQNYDTTHAAYYYPWLTVADSFGEKGDEINIAPSGHVLGIYARSDVQRGVHKAPANEVVKSIRNFETRLTKGEQDILNPIHINCFRDFRDANRGLRLYGARTLSSDPEWRYVNVRRLFLFLEKSIDNSMQWAVFEPNAEPLWATVKRSLTNFLITVWRSGALVGLTQDEAFFVNVGLDTMSQGDVDNGRLIVEIGVAAAKPAEFVIFRFSQKTRDAQD